MRNVRFGTRDAHPLRHLLRFTGLGILMVKARRRAGRRGNGPDGPWQFSRCRLEDVDPASGATPFLSVVLPFGDSPRVVETLS